MKIELFGAAKTVTGSCYSITTKECKILIDCGMFQGDKEETRLNFEKFGFNPKEYKALLLTHAHLDHCGRIPKLVKEGFKGKIYATSATKDLARVVMLDAAKIAFYDTRYENKRRARNGLPPREPVFSEKDVHNAMKLFKLIKYNEPVKVGKTITAKFFDAGHILGSASIQLQIFDHHRCQ